MSLVPLHITPKCRSATDLKNTLNTNSYLHLIHNKRKFLYLYLLTYSLTPHSTVFLTKLNGLQLVKKFPAFYGTRRFITAFTSSRQLSLSRANSIQSIPPQATSWWPNLILSSQLRLGLPSGLFLSGLPTKTLYTTLRSPIRATCPSHLITIYK